MYQRTLNHADMSGNVDMSVTGLYVGKGAHQPPRSPSSQHILLKRADQTDTGIWDLGRQYFMRWIWPWPDI